MFLRKSGVGAAVAALMAFWGLPAAALPFNYETGFQAEEEPGPRDLPPERQVVSQVHRSDLDLVDEDAHRSPTGALAPVLDAGGVTAGRDDL